MDTGEAAAAGQSHLWTLMQRVERCRHQAEVWLTRMEKASPEARAEMTALAAGWLALADEIARLAGD